ncbi:MAG: Glutathione peroxidase family protein [uncultured Campylobacterales bacterium]|uniref:Glutathione peroxidase n=1 Tax=uncultured Campylobacterales bacterium TaxID=352960 RepID=A0A6S6T072_9BACT|nr:MAG: Glutathione peroxidase family protein [uncultured Campylobacterales bacterium]
MNIYDFDVTTIDNQEISMNKYKNRVLLIVNTASKCGFTSQYKELEEIHNEYKDKGLSVLGFPCNQFMSQEPDDEKAIKEFCQLNYGVSFDMFAKIDVNGDRAAPIYQYLKSEGKGLLNSEAIKWNFTKFLVDSNGKVFKRYASATNPKDMKSDIKALLNNEK